MSESEESEEQEEEEEEEEEEALDPQLRQEITDFAIKNTKTNEVTFKALEALRALFKKAKVDLFDYIDDGSTQRLVARCYLKFGRSKGAIAKLTDSRWTLDTKAFIQAFGWRISLSERFLAELVTLEQTSRATSTSFDQILGLLKTKSNERRGDDGAPRIKRERVARGPLWVPTDVKDARIEYEKQHLVVPADERQSVADNANSEQHTDHDHDHDHVDPADTGTGQSLVNVSQIRRQPSANSVAHGQHVQTSQIRSRSRNRKRKHLNASVEDSKNAEAAARTRSSTNPSPSPPEKRVRGRTRLPSSPEEFTRNLSGDLLIPDSSGIEFGRKAETPLQDLPTLHDDIHMSLFDDELGSFHFHTPPRTKASKRDPSPLGSRADADPRIDSTSPAIPGSTVPPERAALLPPRAAEQRLAGNGSTVEPAQRYSESIPTHLGQLTTWLSDHDLYVVLQMLRLNDWQLVQHIEPPPGISWKQHAEDRERSGKRIRVDKTTSSLLVPVLLPTSHWVLFVVDLSCTTISLFDSYSRLWKASHEAQSVVSDAIVRILGLDHGEEHWDLRTAHEIIQQEDNHSCGVHVLLNALCEMYGLARERQSVALVRTLFHVAAINTPLSHLEKTSLFKVLTFNTVPANRSNDSTHQPRLDLSEGLNETLQRLKEHAANLSHGTIQADLRFERLHRFLDSMHAKSVRNIHMLEGQLDALEKDTANYRSKISALDSNTRTLRNGHRKVLEGLRELLEGDNQSHSQIESRRQNSQRICDSIDIMLKELDKLRHQFVIYRAIVQDRATTAINALDELSRAIDR